jgi:hypothetical protein
MVHSILRIRSALSFALELINTHLPTFVITAAKYLTLPQLLKICH